MAAEMNRNSDGVGSFVRHGPDYWRGIIAQWRRSGLTQAEFARRNGFSKCIISSWKNRFEREDKGKRNGKQKREPSGRAFLPVKVVAARSAEPGFVEVQLRGGRTIRFREDIAPGTLESIVRVLESRE